MDKNEVNLSLLATCSFYGQSLMKIRERDVFEFTATRAGMSTAIVVGVHGNEQNSVDALYNVLPNLKILRGRVFFIIGNPEALAANVRFKDCDLNRLFLPDQLLTVDQKKSYEYQRAQRIKMFLNASTALLCGHSSETKNSVAFQICEQNGHLLASTLPGKYVVSGFDALCPGGTDAYMNARPGSIGICMESGPLEASDTTKTAELAFTNFLIARGHINSYKGFPSFAKTHIQVDKAYRSKTSSFIHSRNWADFDHISTGTTIGKESDAVEICTAADSLILFPDDRDQPDKECFYLARKVS